MKKVMEPDPVGQKSTDPILIPGVYYENWNSWTYSREPVLILYVTCYSHEARHFLKVPSPPQRVKKLVRKITQRLDLNYYKK